MKPHQKIAKLGITEDMPIAKQKSTIFFNVVMRIVAAMFILIAAGFYFIKGTH